MAGKCPKCGGLLSEVRIEPIKIKSAGGADYKGASFNCVFCYSVLSVTVDPLAFAQEIAAHLKQE